MTRSEFEAKWQSQRTALAGLAAQVDAGHLLDAVLADYRSIEDGPGEELLTRREAAELCGYSEDHLSRLANRGAIPVVRPGGPKGRMYFRRADLPQRVAQRHTSHTGVHELASRLLRGREGHHGQS